MTPTERMLLEALRDAELMVEEAAKLLRKHYPRTAKMYDGAALGYRSAITAAEAALPKWIDEARAIPEALFASLAMTPEQLNRAEWRAVEHVLAEAKRTMEAGCPPGRYSWMDEAVKIAAGNGAGPQTGDTAPTLTPKPIPSGGWRPIESAPRDGTWFIALQNGLTYPCEWQATEPDEGTGYEGWWDHFNDSFEEPTHWMPLPQSPQGEGEAP